MSGRRAEDQDGHCLRCGAALVRCGCGKSWKPCEDCGYPPQEVPKAETPTERRRCHCREQEEASWRSRYIRLEEPLYLPRRRKDDAVGNGWTESHEPEV